MSSLTDEGQKRLSDCESKLSALKTVHKLAEFADQLDANKHRNNNLLNNLCTGLEKFLGFDPSSKGYDGSGIVYSDLDRLCDGVMAFLYQVLKDVSEKQPYSVGKEKLNEAVDQIERKLASGHTGFKSVITDVVKGVSQYNVEVHDSNDKVSGQINVLLGHLKEEFSNNMNKLSDERIKQWSPHDAEKEVTPTKKLAEQYVQYGRDFDHNINKLTNEINDLNAQCKNNINLAKKQMEHETQRLEKLAGKEHSKLEVTKQKINDTLNGITVRVECNIRDQVKALLEYLTKEVQKIMKNLRSISERLAQYIHKLGKWIGDADSAVKKALTQVEIIIAAVNENDASRYPSLIKSAVQQIESAVLVLHSSGDEARNKVTESVKTALGKVKSMDEALKGDLWKVKTAVEGQVGKIKTAIGKLYDKVKNGDDGSADFEENKQKIEDVIREVHAKVKTIDGSGGGRDSTTGLQGIRIKVSKYISKYGKEYEQGIDKWVRSIFTKNDAVTSCMSSYVSGYEAHFTAEIKKNHQTLANVSEQVKKKVIEELTRMAQSAASTLNPTGNVDDMLKSIRTFLARFSGQELLKKIKDIVRNIESAIVDTDKKGYSTNNTDISYAVRIILQAISTTNEKMGEQIQKLAEDCQIGANVDDAFNTADKLFENLKKSLKIGSKTNYAAAVDTAIDQVKTTLDAEIGTNDPKSPSVLPLGTDGRVKLPDAEEKFKGYKTFVKQDSTGLEALKDGMKGEDKEGSLPAAIGAIKDTAKEDFEAASKDAQNGAIFSILSEEIKKTIKELLQAYERVGRAMNEKLDKLKLNKLGMKDARKGSLQELHNQLSALQSKTFKDAMDWTKKFESLATTNCKKAIEELKSHVDQQVETATEKLTTQAQKHYVSTLKTELQNFTVRVQGHLTGLPTLIDKDLVQGYKGLMKTVQGVKFIVKLKETSEFDTSADTTLLTKLKDAVPLPPGQAKPTKENFKALVSAFEHYFNNINGYVKNEIKRLNEQHEQTLSYKLTHAESEYNKKVNASRLDGVHNELTKLLCQISARNTYDHYVPGLLDGLSEALDGLRPECYALSSTPLLDCIGSGLRGLVGELRFAYISSYDCAAYDFNWDADGRKCAKVCLTIIPVLFNELYPLFYHCCNGWKTYRIEGRDNKNELRDYLQKQGYAIDNLKKDHAGREVAVCCNVGFKERNEFDKDAHDFESLEKYITHYEGKGVISKLFIYLNDYYKVCHLSTSSATRNPSSVYDMLQWLCGLSYNVVYHDLSFDGFSGLFEKPEEPEYEEGGVSFGDEDEDTLAAYPRNITASDMRDALTEVCHYSYDVLVAIQGHGHAGGIYAVDFNTNSQGFSYPANSGQCIDMLIDILHRLYQQLYFVYCQCCNDEICSGWRGCLYGNAIGGSDWKCNQNADQIINEKADQKCDQHPSCGLKSPLQSFLEDGLQGFLPHQLIEVGCGTKCSLGNHKGIPCKTPMGFNDISGKASHTRKGEHLRGVLRVYCGKPNAPLTLLCNYLTCLLSRPPQTLGEMFSFYYHLTDRWGMSGNGHKREAFDEKVTAANFGRQYNELNVYHLFSPSHSALKKGHSDGSLGSLVCLSKDSVVCGPFLRPISYAIYETFSAKHADKYLSWIVYLTQTFYDLLKKLYDECNSKCGSRGSNCHVKACVKECPTTSKQDPPRYHHRNCKSIVSCNSTMPTLAKYGFVLGDPEKLHGSERSQTKRTCRDFCDVFAEAFEEDSHLVKFFKAIDNFIFTIRQPFIWLNVALWLLSLLYLICVMVGRLDVLHIRSHLRSPSSHKITAQSLLAAAQVGRLAKISYLQP